MGTLCPASFWATEAALSLAVLTYNLTVLFQRHLGWQAKVTIHSLRFWLFISKCEQSVDNFPLTLPEKRRIKSYRPESLRKACRLREAVKD